MTESCFVCSDTVGTIATAFEDGGWRAVDSTDGGGPQGGGGRRVSARAR